MAFFGLIFGIGFTISKIVEIEESIFIYGLTLLLFIVAYKIALRLTSGKAEITLHKKNIEFKWIKKPFFRFQQDVNLDVGDVDGWKFRSEYQYDYFKIYSSKPSIGFERLPEWHPAKDDFYEFKLQFSQWFAKLKERQK
jgi:hypothetical protein